ncbi:MAG: hypothetical protein H6Q52_262 [Deltaproteobacteria bacterium]|nr:hypothetical protein [Deltaproteobacteria bacterium]
MTRPQKARTAFLCCFTAVMIVIVCLVPRFGQSPDYHIFADTRMLYGVPNFLNVISSGGFCIVGIVGLILLIFRPKVFVFEKSRERWPYIVLFTGILLTAFGSSWYHWAPANGTLLWDRLPMTIIFAAFLSATIMERISVNAGLISVFPCVLIGMATVLYWYAAEANGHGDLRPYVFMQFYPIIGIPLAMMLLPGRYTQAGCLLLIIGLYGCAKLLEVYDAQIYSHLRAVSGHTLKHVAAAIALTPLFVMLHYREYIKRKE